MADGRGQGLSGLAFALAWVRNPRRVGAIAPASRALAQAVAAEVSRVGPELLLEIGAGTGAITRALADLGPPPDRFFIIERDLGRINTRLYGLPAAMTPAELSRVRSFYFMDPASGDETLGAPTSREFPEHVICRMGDRVFRLTLRPRDQR